MNPTDVARPLYALWFRRYAPFSSFGFPPFEGDHRTGPSTSPKATSRTYGCVMFNRRSVVNHFANSSGTRYTLGLDAEAVADVSMTVVRTTLHGPDLIEFKASTAGANPLVPGSPDIDTFVDVRVSFLPPNFMSIRCEARGDNFPNLEVFLRSAGDRSALLIDGRTTGGRRTGPMSRLAGSHADQLLGLTQATYVLDADGRLIHDYVASPTVM